MDAINIIVIGLVVVGGLFLGFLLMRRDRGGSSPSPLEYFVPLNFNHDFTQGFVSHSILVEGDKRQQDIPNGFEYYFRENSQDVFGGFKPAWVYEHKEGGASVFGMESKQISSANGYTMRVIMEQGLTYLVKVILNDGITSHRLHMNLKARVQDVYNPTHIVDASPHILLAGQNEYVWVFKPQSTSTFDVTAYLQAQYPDVEGKVFWKGIQLMLVPNDWNGLDI